jgi:Zn-dependent M16 (insulinase) family peptidase
VESQQDFLLDLLSEHKAQVEEKITTKARKFASKQLEKQYQVNLAFKELAQKIKKAHKNKEWRRAKRATSELLQQLEEHEQDLIVADISPHGWLAVSKLRNSSELPKELRKKLSVVEKDLEAQKNKHGGAKKKLFPLPQQSQGGAGRQRQPDKKYSPEEALSFATKQVRTGLCSMCHKAFHYYRECPVFWTRVNEGREANNKGGGDN